MPLINHRRRNAVEPGEEAVLDWESDDVLDKVYELAYEGYYDAEIADKLRVTRGCFREAKSRHERLRCVLEESRAEAAESGVQEAPSPALFREMWDACDGKRSKLLEKLRIGWTTLYKWMQERPEFIDIMAERDIKFLEQADIAGRILSLGGVNEKDTFPGWSRLPDPNMLRWYMNTLGRRYGYGESASVPACDGSREARADGEGVDIESWIYREIEAKKAQQEEDGGEVGAAPEAEAGAHDNQP